jgi:hypothetical protein
MTWTPEKKAQAAGEHWELVDTVDDGKLVHRVYGICGVSNHQAQQFVMNAARRGSKFHIEALRFIAHTVQQTNRGRKK